VAARTYDRMIGTFPAPNQIALMRHIGLKQERADEQKREESV
jgi:hypothetical protein